MKRKQRAIMLVELLLGILISAGVVMILGLVMTRLFAVNSHAQAHQQFVTNLGRLSRQFRRDVHDAASVTLADRTNRPEAAPANELALRLGSQTVIYSLATGGVERAVSAGSENVRRELFALPGFKPLALDLDEHRREVELTIGRLAHPTQPDGEVSGEFTILAVLRSHAADEEQP